MYMDQGVEMINPFKLERYFAQYEFNVRHLLSPSDVEALSQSALLEMASPVVRELWQNLSLGYTDSQGHPLMREEIANLYTNIYPEQIVTAVPEEAIYIAMHTLLKPGDHVISIFPAYQSLYEVATSIGCNVSFWKLHPCPEGWELYMDELYKALRPNTRLLVINFPHNPTGFLPTRQQLDDILQFAEKHNLIVFSDEMYRLLEYHETDRLPAVCDLYERGISLSGLSKSFALPGLRLGWLATQMIHLPQIWLTAKDYTTICGSAPSEILGLMALQAKEDILRRSRQIVLGNLASVEDVFARHADHVTFLKPRAGSVAFPVWHGPPSVERFCQDMLEQYDMMVLPGSIFDVIRPHFRVGLGRKTLPASLELLESYLMSLSQGRMPVFISRYPLHTPRVTSTPISAVRS
jgi:aspartate/methionine/tyrosine aminotransferase